MKLTGAVILVLSMVFLSSCKNIEYPEKNGNLTIIKLNGTPFKRGYLHGKFLKPEIDTIIYRWKKEVEESFELDFDTVIESFFAETTFVDTIKKHCPELLDEVRGIAKGSKQEFHVILALQMSEEIEIADKYLFSGRCTSISTSNATKHQTIVAQNMDPPQFLQGFPTLLHIQNNKTDNESFVYTFPGFIGLCGMSRNIAVACNGISMLNHKKDGLPVAFIMRTLLTKNNEKEAFKYTEHISHSTPQCYSIGGLHTAKCFECSANSVAEFQSFNDTDISLHTNFSAQNTDFNKAYIELLAQYGKTPSDPYYCPRYFLAYDLIKDTGFNLSVENIKTILSSTKSDIEPISNKNTYGCLIMEFGANPVLYISPGKPHETNFITLQFEKK